MTQKYSARLCDKNDHGAPQSNHLGWGTYNYTPDKINDIVDTSGASATADITSIPSPLAQMHVFDESFKVVEQMRNQPFTAPTPFHRLVSFCLDAWEIVFTFDSHPGLDFTRWNRMNQLAGLRQSPSAGHRLLADTLDLYLSHNTNPRLKAIEDIYILSYKGKAFAGTSPLTGFFLTANNLSFVKLHDSNGRPFFDASNTLPLSQRSYNFQLFMGRLITAYAQETTFFFNHFRQYVVNELKASPFIVKLQEQVFNGYPAVQFAQDYPNPLTNAKGEQLNLFYSVNGMSLNFSLPEWTVEIDAATCQMIIQPSKPIDAKAELPLVLRENIQGTYLQGKPMPAGTAIARDTCDENGVQIPLKQRLLPIYNKPYPYLTAGDFLEEYLIDLGYTVNDTAFHTGKLVGFDELGFTYLLPIKPLYFRYFCHDDLYKNLCITKRVSDILVELTIPLSNNNRVVLTRTYQLLSIMPTPEQVHTSLESGGTGGIGAIVAAPIGMTINPIIKIPATGGTLSPYNDYYKVGVVSQPLMSTSAAINCLTFYREATTAGGILSVQSPSEAPSLRTPGIDKLSTFHSGGSDFAAVDYDFYVFGDYDENALLNRQTPQNCEFDFIVLTFDNKVSQAVRGIVYPKWQQPTLNAAVWEAAVDFGTSNSFVACCQKGQTPTAFAVDATELQLVRLDCPSNYPGLTSDTQRFENILSHGGTSITTLLTEIQRQIEQPSVIGLPHDAFCSKMPFTSAIATAQQAGVNTLTADEAGIPFTLGRYRQLDCIEVHTNIKWEAMNVGSVERVRLSLFIKQLLRMIRNKVMLQHGDPSKTELLWFKPVSMSAYRQGQYAALWQGHMEMIFHQSRGNVQCITESEAPYYVHFAKGSLSGGERPTLSIDIGGGTTDIFVFKGQHPLFANSSMMASRAIFGEVLADANAQSHNTAMLSYFTPLMQSVIDNMRNNSDLDIKRVGNELHNIHQDYLNTLGYRAEDIIGFYFARPEFQFAQRLADSSGTPFKLTFLFFFTALHYQCATFLRDKGLSAPLDICMSGNGSRMISILDPNAAANGSLFAQYVSEIYRHVLGENFAHTIRILTLPNPKEATALGGLHRPNAQTNVGTVSQAKVCVNVGEHIYDATSGVEITGLSPEQITYGDLGIGAPAKYKFSAAGSEYVDFVKFFTRTLHQKFNFKNSFGISCNMNQVEQLLGEETQVDVDFNKAFTKLNHEKTTDEVINESLFLYPVYEALNRLSGYLLQQQRLNQNI